jgi:hypothetical protein
MKTNSIKWNNKKWLYCINCNDKTGYQDGVCYSCSRKVPKYIPNNQKRLYLLKGKKKLKLV